MARDTAEFLRLMNEANEKIAKWEAEQAKKVPGTDPVRLARDAERRERLGQLRAREHPTKRPHVAYPVFGHVNLRE